MMINKRLINLCEDSKKYIIFTVLSSWIAINYFLSTLFN